MSKAMCEGAPWCLLKPVAGAHACAMHLELPAQQFFSKEGGLVSVEEPDKWKSRYNRYQKAKRLAAAKQAASDATMGKRK